uniref:protein P21-like n=1 Tax=Erigeron canadensis TaxID=72917 RepID=UPI001CB99B0D|nr:protein P21-like [Erigeron canadensis]
MTSFTISAFLLLTPLVFHLANATLFNIKNNCGQTVWAGAVPTGGGKRLDPGQSWLLEVAPGTTTARIWPRTECNFDGSGRGSCVTGDCNGVLECKSFGATPNTVAEFALKQYADYDYFDISIIDGFNLPMQFSPNSGGCTRGIKCNANINGECPAQLRTRGGCNHPCTVTKSDKDCCLGQFIENCQPTPLSNFFKERCPDVYSYKADKTATFSCPSGTNYDVIFCPS